VNSLEVKEPGLYIVSKEGEPKPLLAEVKRSELGTMYLVNQNGFEFRLADLHMLQFRPATLADLVLKEGGAK